MSAKIKVPMFVLALILAICLQASGLLAQCVDRVTVSPGGSADIGKVENKGFTLDETLAFGTLTVVPSGNTNILRYTATPLRTDVTEKVDCEIDGEGKKIVDVTIQSIPTPAPEDVYGAAAKTLVLLFALAVLLESALAVIFHWRPFIELLNPRAVRPLVAVVFAWWFVSYFHLDLVTALVNASNPQISRPINYGGQILTALVLAGGSGGVNSMLVALGFRQVRTPETQPRPAKDKAWIAVRAVRQEGTTGNIDVLIGPPKSSEAGTEPLFAGTIKGKSGVGILSFFARDRGRYPSYGGYEVDATKEVCVVLRAPSSKPPKETTWGPQKPAPGAIIDLDLEI